MIKLPYTCESCGAVKPDGSEYYRVKIITPSGAERNVPACCEKCAETLKDYNTNLHNTRASAVENQTIEKFIWGK